MADFDRNLKIEAQDLIGIGLTVLLGTIVAALALCATGCEIRESPQPQARRNVHVNVQVHPHCPPGRPCPYRRAGCPCQDGGECQCGPRCQCRFDLRLRKALSLPGTARLSTEGPAVNLPVESRCRNYNGGSCVCASTISVLRWQGREDLADQLRRICSGGQSEQSILAKMERLEIEYAYTNSGDVDFIDWCARTKRGATIFWKPGHSCTLVDIDAENAVVLDNNNVGEYEYTPREQFIRRWRGYGGFALTPLAGVPAPPIPHLAHSLRKGFPLCSESRSY